MKRYIEVKNGGQSSLFYLSFWIELIFLFAKKKLQVRVWFLCIYKSGQNLGFLE